MAGHCSPSTSVKENGGGKSHNERTMAKVTRMAGGAKVKKEAGHCSRVRCYQASGPVLVVRCVWLGKKQRNAKKDVWRARTKKLIEHK